MSASGVSIRITQRECRCETLKDGKIRPVLVGGDDASSEIDGRSEKARSGKDVKCYALS